MPAHPAPPPADASPADPSASDTRHLDALLRLGEHDAEPRVRLAALAAATRFVLDAAAWLRIARAAWRIVAALPAGDPLRGEVLSFAAGLPIRSLREHLRELAADAREPEHALIAQALDRVADPGRIPALIAGLAHGEYGNYRPLAAMPLEDAGLSPADLAPPQPHDHDEANSALWWALCRARLGDLGPFDAFFSPPPAGDEWRVPGLFWGSPWTAHAAVAAIRPIPPAMHRHLLAALDKQGEQDRRSGDHDRLRALELTVHAATGIADAQGLPLEPASAPGPVALPEPFNPPESAATLAERQLRAPPSGFDDAQVGWMIAREPARRFVPALLALDRPGLATAARVRLLQLIGLAADAQAGRAASPWRGALAGGGEDAIAARHELIDDRPRPAARGRPDEPADDGASELDIRSLRVGAAPVDRDAGTSRPRSAGAAGRSRGRGASTAAPERVPGAAADDATPDDTAAGRQADRDARRVHAQLLHEGVPRRHFVAGARTRLRCWIGLRQAGIPSANAPIQHVELPAGGLELVVELCWTGLRGGEPTCRGDGPAGRIRLPAERSLPSDSCELAIEVPADIDALVAQILFRYRGKVFEAVTVSAAVRPAGSSEAELAEPRVEVSFGQREVIALAERAPVDATLVFGPRHLRLFGGQGGRIYDLGDTERLMAVLNEALFLADTDLVRRREQRGAQTGEAALDAGSAEVTELLRTLAMHGATLYENLRRQGFADPGERIQVINLDEARAVPLEFIYDRGVPRRGAPLCAGWQAALGGDDGHCATCEAAATGAAGSWRDTICPLGFWAMRKVIERFDASRLEDLSLPAPPRRSLRPLDAALCASTHYVPEAERALLSATLSARIPAPTLVDDWDQWEQAVAHDSPPLLILLAHHDLDAGLDYLEIGDEALAEEKRWRFRPQLNEALINPAPIDPGPIVLLLGCETARQVAETGYGGLAAQFKDFHASLVLGTLAKILGRHAGPLAAELVAELAAVDTADADFGTLLRRIRRRLLARGVLMAFALVAIGDADWRLPVRARPAPGPSPASSTAG